MHSPVAVFKEFWREAMSKGLLKHRNAVCISTVDAEGYPSSRFVDLKEAEESGFVFCTHLNSSKAMDIKRNPKAGMTMWWEHVAIQIRIRGLCEPISESEADAHWASRVRDAQIASVTFQQSQPLARLDLLAKEYSHAVAKHEGGAIARPPNWGGFRLRPEYIEFLEFKESRLHHRTVYALAAGQWHMSFLQP